ncbi:MAG: hypothetical protein J6W51_02285 [Fibrobacter sp.]|nr:hypothetical protein [Fibrobacter sp.]
MIKKIAILALAVSAAFSNAFAAERTCSISNLKGSKIYTGSPIKPEPVVTCDDGSTPSDISISYGENINAGENAGSVTVTINDDGTKVTSTFTIAQRDVSIVIRDTTKEKGAADPEFTWAIEEEDALIKVVKSSALEELKTGLKDLIKLERVAGEELVIKEGEHKGEPYKYAITFKDGVSEKIGETFPNFNVMPPETPGYLTITKKHVTVSAKDTSKVYGKTDPKFEYTIEGLEKTKYALLGDIEVTRTKGDTVGEYPISVTVENMETEDYIVAVNGATFTITKAKVAVSVDDVTKVYGAATPEFTYKVDGLVGEDNLNDVKLTCKDCSDDGLEAVGKYEIAVSIKETSNPNYLISSTENGTLTVTPKAATVTVADTAKTYGDEDPKFTFTTEGLVTATESLEGATITRAKGDTVGTYKINVAFADGSNPNYKLTVKSGTLTISPKAVTLTVDDVSKKFGEKDPELTYTVDGLVTIGETEDKLAGVTLSREKGEDAGEYKITATVDAKANPNYVVTVDEKEAKLTIVANNDEIVVTIKGHTSTGVYNGKEQTVHGYDISSNSDAYSLKFVEYTKTDAGDSVVSGTNAGTYKMGLSKDNFKNTSVNYPNVTFEVTDGSLEITPKSLVVSAVADSITYGEELPTEFKWTVDSLLNGDALDNIHVSIEKTGLLDAGEYVLDFDKKEPTTTNYVVSKYVPAAFKVLKRSVTVAIADTSKVYGTRDPALDSLVTITGLREGDSLEGITVAREKGEDVRLDANGQMTSYKIAASIDEDKLNKNYQVKVKQGNFTIKPYTEKITVLIFGDRVERDSTGDTITVPKSYDVRLCGTLCSEAPLDSGFEYSVNFVTYRDSVIIIDPDTKDSVLDVTTTSVSGVRAYLYPFNLRVDHFVNISPNFSNVQFRITTDGTLIIKKPVEIPTKIVSVKGADLLGLSSVGRRIQVSGSTVGNRFEVRNMQGKVVRSGFVPSANFEIPVANAGVYLVRVGSVVRKVRIK